LRRNKEPRLKPNASKPMTKKSKLSLLGIVIVILIVIIVSLFLMKKKTSVTPPQGAKPAASQPVQGLTPITTPVTLEAPPTEPQAQKPEVIAALFAERYGSYSNESNYQNLRDLFPQMTARERTELQSFMNTHPFQVAAYTGTTTKVVRTEKRTSNTDHASLTVFTQRIEATQANPRARIYYQTADVELVKDGLSWLVDRFIWK